MTVANVTLPFDTSTVPVLLRGTVLYAPPPVFSRTPLGSLLITGAVPVPRLKFSLDIILMRPVTLLRTAPLSSVHVPVPMSSIVPVLSS